MGALKSVLLTTRLSNLPPLNGFMAHCETTITHVFDTRWRVAVLGARLGASDVATTSDLFVSIAINVNT